jgi:hypothetical protein
VIRDAVIGERVHEDIEPLAVQHQPRHQPREFFGREGHLIHSYRMRPDRFVVPAPDPNPREILADGGSQPLRGRPGLRRVIKVRVVSRDDAGIGEYLSQADLPC